MSWTGENHYLTPWFSWKCVLKGRVMWKNTRWHHVTLISRSELILSGLLSLESFQRHPLEHKSTEIPHTRQREVGRKTQREVGLQGPGGWELCCPAVGSCWVWHCRGYILHTCLEGWGWWAGPQQVQLEPSKGSQHGGFPGFPSQLINHLRPWSPPATGFLLLKYRHPPWTLRA